ncbi:MAG: GGDEF domain-containing protein [Desulfobulbaceae bacterium]|nr:GGDEF domain-containing protein [Desulfobulbaceae bacterium]
MNATEQTDQQHSLWRRAWQPFFNLSVYGKFVLVLTSFLAGFILIGLHNLYFVNNLKEKLGQLQTNPSSSTIQDTINMADIYLQNGGFLVAGIMIILTITSFLSVRMMVSLLHDMTRGLRSVRNSAGETQGCQVVESIPIISNDEIGTVAREVNGIISDIQSISRFRRVIEADETTHDVYKRLAYVFQERLDLNTFVIWEVNKSEDSIEAVFTSPPDFEEEICQMSCANLCRAVRTGDIVSSTGYPGICPIFPLPDVMTHSCVPMMVGGQILGVVQFLFLYVNSPEREEHFKNSLRRARQYLMEALPVLHAKRLAQNLHQMAIRDTLTGLYNRRFLEGNINPILAGIQRRESNMAILMADMDFFKKVNDEYGHESGDSVLKALSHILQSEVRHSDLVIRYGGEEFLILLVDCHPKEFAIQVAEKIRSKVEGHQFRIEGGSLRKTLSIGISEFPGDTAAFWEAVKFADVALYRAKESGRNQVVRFDPSMWDTEDY